MYTPRCVEDSEVQATVEYKNKACDAHRVRTSYQSTSTPTPSADHGQPDEFEDALLDYAMRSNGLQRQGQSSQMQPAHRMLTTFLLLFLCLTACQSACPAPTSWYHQKSEDEAQGEAETTICRQLGSQAASIGPHSAETLADLQQHTIRPFIADTLLLLTPAQLASNPILGTISPRLLDWII